MSKSPLEVVQAILADPTNKQVVDALVAPDATYVSLNADNPELKTIMPWAGTQSGPAAITGTCARVRRHWTSEAFTVEEMFASGEDVAVFGRFTYRSVTLGKAVTSPFSIQAKVRDGRLTFMRFLEDTFGTAATFRSGGTATYRSEPDGGAVSIGAGAPPAGQAAAPDQPIRQGDRR